MLTKQYGVIYVHEHHTYDKNKRWICDCGDLLTINLASLKLKK